MELKTWGASTTMKTRIAFTAIILATLAVVLDTSNLAIIASGYLVLAFADYILNSWLPRWMANARHEREEARRMEARQSMYTAEEWRMMRLDTPEERRSVRAKIMRTGRGAN